LPLQITKPVSSRKWRKIITYVFEWAFHYQFFAEGELLKPVFCDLKSKFPLILKIKYRRFNGNGRSLD
jgi:hypothetical protein